MEEIVIYVTCASQEEAEKIARSLVEQKLAACANILPKVTSIFSWKGETCNETECMMILKSRLPLFEKLSATIKKLHGYEVPEIIALPIIAGSEDYLKWLYENTKPA